MLVLYGGGSAKTRTMPFTWTQRWSVVLDRLFWAVYQPFEAPGTYRNLMGQSKVSSLALGPLKTQNHLAVSCLSTHICSTE